jgi:hypothetical protein
MYMKKITYLFISLVVVLDNRGMAGSIQKWNSPFDK